MRFLFYFINKQVNIFLSNNETVFMYYRVCLCFSSAINMMNGAVSHYWGQGEHLAFIWLCYRLIDLGCDIFDLFISPHFFASVVLTFHIFPRALLSEIVEAKSFVKINPFCNARSTVPHIEVSLNAVYEEVKLPEGFHHFSVSFRCEEIMLFIK